MEKHERKAESMNGTEVRIDKDLVERMIIQVLSEQLGQLSCGCKQLTGGDEDLLMKFREEADGVLRMEVPRIAVRPEDRLNTGCEKDRVYTRDIFTLAQSPRLGCGIMEMEQTTFDWKLDYDEIDYVMEGFLTIIKNGKCVTAGPGEVILIPKDSAIQFSVPGKARFLYVTYPADWAG